MTVEINITISDKEKTANDTISALSSSDNVNSAGVIISNRRLKMWKMTTSRAYYVV